MERPPHMAKPPQQQIIARALEIISDEGKWTRDSMARLADSKPCALGFYRVMKPVDGPCACGQSGAARPPYDQ